MVKIAKAIADEIYSNLYNSEDGDTYEGEHQGYEYIATKYLQGHVERGGDEYGGFWEEVGYTDSEEYDVEIYSPNGSRLIILETEVEKLL